MSISTLTAGNIPQSYNFATQIPSSVGSIMSSFSAKLTGILGSAFLISKAHKREAQFRFPHQLSFDDFLKKGIPKSMANIAISAGTWATLGLGFGVAVGTGATISAGVLGALYARSISKRLKNIKNSALTQDEIDAKMAIPENKSKLDAIYEIYKDAKKGNEDARKQFLQLPGARDESWEKVIQQLRKPLEIISENREKIYRTGILMPKAPEHAEFNEKSEKEAILKTANEDTKRFLWWTHNEDIKYWQKNRQITTMLNIDNTRTGNWHMCDI